MARPARRRRLREAYHFDCACPRCAAEADGGEPVGERVDAGAAGGGTWEGWVEAAWAEAGAMAARLPPSSSAVGVYLLKAALRLGRKLPPHLLPAAAVAGGGGPDPAGCAAVRRQLPCHSCSCCE